MRTKLLFLFVVLALLAALMLNAPAHAQPGDFQATVVVTATPSPTLTATITPTSTLTATTTLTPTLSPVVVSPTAMPTPTLLPLPMWTPLPIPTFSFQPILPHLLIPCETCRPAPPPEQGSEHGEGK
jgi:hypothetical protein